jgi:hypothetical protein
METREEEKTMECVLMERDGLCEPHDLDPDDIEETGCFATISGWFGIEEPVEVPVYRHVPTGCEVFIRGELER